MIRIGVASGGLQYDRIDLFRRCGDGCYLSVFFGGGDPVGSVNVPLSRDQARELAGGLLGVADQLGPGVMERGERSFSYRLRRSEGCRQK